MHLEDRLGRGPRFERHRRRIEAPEERKAEEPLMNKMKKFVTVLVAIAALSCGWAALASGAELGFYQQGDVNLNGPSYGWWYGCSPTSAGMMMGYYDINGYQGLTYGNLVPGGVAETSTSYGDAAWDDAKVKNIIASQGYVNDYYRYWDGTKWVADSNCGFTAYQGSGDDVATTPHANNCLGDFMGTSQALKGNINGSTTFYFWTDGTKTYAKNLIGFSDGMVGMDKYFRYAGYGTGVALADDMSFYTQLIYSTNTPYGCTFADYQALINAGLVAMIQVEGHSMFGYGYTVDGKIIFDDTWGHHDLTMDWGGSYDGMNQWGITVFTPSQVPLPSSLLLMISGLAGLVGFRLRK
jgi:hypothetical protein